MILVDTSVWIDHLANPDERFSEWVERDEIGTHHLVIEELSLGSLADRAGFLGSLADLRRFPRADHAEVMAMVGSHTLWSRGLGAVDVHLIASARMQRGGRLWTRDKRMRQAALAVGVPVVP